MKRFFAFAVLACASLVATAATAIFPEAYTKKFTGTGTNDNDVVIQTDDVQQYDTFFLQSTGGAMDVFVSLDGTNYSTAALSIADLGAEDTVPVLVTVANRTYAFRGKFKYIRVLQNGASAVTAASLRAGNM